MTTENDMWDILAIIRAGLPNAFLKVTEADAQAMVNVWTEMFQDYPAGLVMAAAKTYIWNDKTGRFPSPGSIREWMEDIRKIIGQCSYGRTVREYIGAAADRYPAAVQDYINHTAQEDYKKRTGHLPPTEAEIMEFAMRHIKSLTGGE